MIAPLSNKLNMMKAFGRAAALSCLLLARQAEAGELRVELPASIEAREGSFYLGEYAEIDGEPALAGCASMAVISPKGGSFSRPDVIEALGATRLAGSDVALRMPDIVQVLPESDVAADLRAMTSWDWRIEIDELSESPKRGEYSLPPRVLPGARSLAMKLIDSSGRKSNKQIKLRWYQPVVYATRAIERDAKIDPSSLGVRIDTVGMTVPLVSDMARLRHSTLRRALLSGEPIAAGDVEAAAIVRSGSSVKLVAYVNGLGVEVEGIALQRGGMGDVIRVRNLSTRKILSGTVVDVGRVAINNNNN
ncbi:MAG: flagellar basal body P-ring formation chaperone FlgA [Synergistaceae bacterium]|jgi:flagella basal body P-ring formation protein FlgA|nr:flagellar basal body P-ring formation chaperone FlgA [Synergistaceae bacterium]